MCPSSSNALILQTYVNFSSISIGSFTWLPVIKLQSMAKQKTCNMCLKNRRNCRLGHFSSGLQVLTCCGFTSTVLFGICLRHGFLDSSLDEKQRKINGGWGSACEKSYIAVPKLRQDITGGTERVSPARIENQEVHNH